MARSPRTRWVCPVCGNARLGSRRPRANASIRYCLECSAASDLLVEREAPALAAKRLRAAESRKAAEQRKRERERAARLVECVDMDGNPFVLDIDEEVARIMRLPTVAEARRKMWASPQFRPTVIVRRSSKHRGASWGVAAGSEIRASFGPEPEIIRAIELLLHEVCHVVAPHREHHGRLFRRLLCKAATERWPGLKIRPDERRGVYELDELIFERVRAMEGARR